MLQPLRLEWWNAKDLQDNPHNWRRHPPAQEAALRQLLAEVGWAGAALYNERTKRLIDGHLRKRVLRKGQKIPVLVGNWTQEQELKILLALDPIASMASADKVALDQLLASVQFENSALDPLLQQLGEIPYQTVPAELQEPADQLEHADELQKKWKTALGQLWQAKPHRLICGDSTDSAVLGQLWQGVDRRFQMIWTDPPWSVGYGEKTRWMERRGAQRRRTPIKNDSLKPNEIRKLFGDALRTATRHAASGASIYAAVPSGSLLPFFIGALEGGGFSFMDTLIWVKNVMVLGRGDYHHRHEAVLYGWRQDAAHYFCPDRKQDSVFEIDRPPASPFHPTTKPIELVARMIRNSSRTGDLVFDPFCGSGTTVLAGAQLGRVVLSVELDPRYLAVELERLSAIGLKPMQIE
jgi:DNA modification methylase